MLKCHGTLCTRADTGKKNSPLTLSSSPSSGKEPGLFDLVIINDDLEKAYSELKEVLLEVSPWGFFLPHSWARQVRLCSQAATENVTSSHTWSALSC